MDVIDRPARRNRWWAAVRRIDAELWPPRVAMPGPGDPLERAWQWQVDELSAGTRVFVVLWFGFVLVALMVASWVWSPAPGHQLAGIMLWLTAIGTAARIVGPRLAGWSAGRSRVETVGDEPEGER